MYASKISDETAPKIVSADNMIVTGRATRHIDYKHACKFCGRPTFRTINFYYICSVCEREGLHLQIERIRKAMED